MGACIIMKITHGRYYYKFHETVEKLRKEDNTCYICGSNKKVNPHHIRRVKESDPQYAAANNVVLLCSHHHGKFHQLYGSGKGVNRHNFEVYVKKEHLQAIEKLEKENIELKNYKETVISTVNSAVKTERTELGSSVLKQLSENLGVKIK